MALALPSPSSAGTALALPPPALQGRRWPSLPQLCRDSAGPPSPSSAGMALALAPPALQGRRWLSPLPALQGWRWPSLPRLCRDGAGSLLPQLCRDGTGPPSPGSAGTVLALAPPEDAAPPAAAASRHRGVTQLRATRPAHSPPAGFTSGASCTASLYNPTGPASSLVKQILFVCGVRSMQHEVSCLKDCQLYTMHACFTVMGVVLQNRRTCITVMTTSFRLHRSYVSSSLFAIHVLLTWDGGN